MEAYADFSDMPDVVFRINANSGAMITVQPMQPTSIPALSVDVPALFQQLATSAGFPLFDNSIGSMTIPGAIYLWGTPRDQMQELADMAGIDWAIDNATIAIWPHNGARNTTVIPLVSPATGLIKYPSYYDAGIIFETVFNPAIVHQGLIKIESAVLAKTNPDAEHSINSATKRGIDLGYFPANGVWVVNQLNHYLDSKVVNGDWKSVAHCVDPTYGKTHTMITPNILPSP